MNTEKTSVKACSAKSYWFLILLYVVLQILLPLLMQHLFPVMNNSGSHYGLLVVCIIFSWSSILRCHPSSKLRKIIKVWILSSTILIASNMVGHVLFIKEESYLMALAVLVPGLFLMVSCLLLIIWSYKKKMNK